MICNVLAADYYPRSSREPATVVLNRIIDGHRTRVMGFRVQNKREAREIAARYNATPWNF